MKLPFSCWLTVFVTRVLIVFPEDVGFEGAFGNGAAAAAAAGFFKWDLTSGGRNGAGATTCVGIPKNLSLCADIGYTQMRLPNLLEHDTMFEISQQAASWVPLLNIKCHPDTQKFICSLFCPVCLDHPIYPCRGLCEKVKTGCESRMKAYGFPWPEMFACQTFPQDNDMCITPGESADVPEDDRCKLCEQALTVENILDHYCRANFAVRGKLKKLRGNQFVFKRMKTLKAGHESKAALAGDQFVLNVTENCCEQKLRVNRIAYFIMGNYENKSLNPTFISTWAVKSSKSFKKSIRMLKKLNCSDIDQLTRPVVKSTTPVPKRNDNSGNKSRRRGNSTLEYKVRKKQ